MVPGRRAAALSSEALCFLSCLPRGKWCSSLRKETSGCQESPQAYCWLKDAEASSVFMTCFEEKMKVELWSQMSQLQIWWWEQGWWWWCWWWRQWWPAVFQVLCMSLACATWIIHIHWILIPQKFEMKIQFSLHFTKRTENLKRQIFCSSNHQVIIKEITWNWNYVKVFFGKTQNLATLVVQAWTLASKDRNKTWWWYSITKNNFERKETFLTSHKGTVVYLRRGG